MSAFLRLVSPLMHPVGLGWLLLWVTAAVCWRRGRKQGAVVSVGLAVLMWMGSQPVLVGGLLAREERRWLGHTVNEAPSADVVIVLGGGWRASRYDYRGLDLSEGADRLIAGFELCRRGRARVLVVGGDAPDGPAPVPPDSEGVRGWLADWGLSGVELLSLGPVYNTRDEAARARELVMARGWKSVLLVTSAFHLERAMEIFRGAGIPVHPVACDFRWVRLGSDAPRWRPFPSEEALDDFAVWWHERMGWLAYRILPKS